MKLHAIAACDRLGGMGYQGGIPWNVPGDKEFFRQRTLHKLMIMGYKTYQGMPRKVFQNRTSVVLTKRRVTPALPNIFFVHDQTSCMQLVKQKNAEGAFVIGGGEIFNLFFSQKMIDELLLSWIPGTYPSDTYFPLYWLEGARDKQCALEGKGFTVYRYIFGEKIGEN